MHVAIALPWERRLQLSQHAPDGVNKKLKRTPIASLAFINIAPKAGTDHILYKKAQKSVSTYINVTQRVPTLARSIFY